ncbi:late competence protein ComER [Neobacillus notoginsengisoli]|uniref:Pyrroline-5-carboxylate reductase n=1 Tax=Neobacillus notoginsengisoli TaxID=1578198 RepID=A0A417YUL0_9BACI|nr:late competence protein ComER [Neobacillus notoginsengisoli]RHW40983.1 late competence protein ComER [Neobacillus notoginsengisoli]
MKIGIIGTGNMGRILAEALLDSGAVEEGSLMAVNRTLAKAEALKKVYPGIHVAEKAAEVAHFADIIFLCVKPLESRGVLMEIASFLAEEKCLVSITSPIRTDQLETTADCSVIRMIPSITNRALAGVTLVTYGEKCSSDWKTKLGELIRKISEPIEIEQQYVRVASDIVSCGPAFFSYLLQEFVLAAVNETNIDEERATNMASGMLIGMGELLRKGHYTLPALQEKVCVKGGITGEGIKVLENGLGDMFRDLFRATHAKFKEDLEHVEKQYRS